MDKEVKEFIDGVGAVDVEPSDKAYSVFRTYFKKQNYFICKKGFLIVHLSRSKKPFWGLGKKFFDLCGQLNTDIFLVLLVAAHEGWVFDKHDITYFIESGRWKLRDADGQYKINPPLPDKNSFLSHRQFLKLIGIQED
jgi:hypothetical protein